MVVDSPPIATKRFMTEAEFDAWCDEDTRAEFVDGEVILLAAEAVIHVRITQFLVQLFGLYLLRKPAGELLGPGYQVRLRSGLKRVPDLLYVSPEHRDRIERTILEGSPDVAWEIISPDSVERDWRTKFGEYESAGVTEYWIIDPYTATTHLYQLGSNGAYVRAEERDGRLESTVIPGLWLRPEWFRQHPLPDPLECLRELGVAL